MRYFQYNTTIRSWVEISKVTYDFIKQHAVINKLDVSLVAIGNEPAIKIVLPAFIFNPFVILFVAAIAMPFLGGNKIAKSLQPRSFAKVCC